MIAHQDTREGRGETVRKLDHKCCITLQSADFSDRSADTHLKRSSFSAGLPRAKTTEARGGSRSGDFPLQNKQRKRQQSTAMRGKTVSIVGRPNVGKSSLFNRLVGYRKAIVYDQPGVTVDRNCAVAAVSPFLCVDTVGFNATDDIAASDLYLVILDAHSGLHRDDWVLLDGLRKQGLPYICAVNKVDHREDESRCLPFYELGVKELFAISALRRRGLERLRTEISAALCIAPATRSKPPRNVIRIAIVGRQNAGKSLLLNKLAGTTVAKVSAIAGTTRDSIDWHYRFASNSYTMTDTAGLRRKVQHTRDKIEFLSMTRTLQTISAAQVVIVVIDVIQGVVEQDVRLVAKALEHCKPVLVVLNKWDLCDDRSPAEHVRICQSITAALPWANYVPVVTASALTNLRISAIKQWVARLCDDYQKRIPTAELNRAFADITTRHTHRLCRGKRLQFYYAVQAETEPPTFVIMCNAPDAIEESYQRYLANRLRRELGFNSVPVRVIYRR